jgi:hypothetical protein
MKISKAFYPNQLPTQIVIVSPDGKSSMFNQSPFRSITESELRSYKGNPISKCKGYDVPDYLLRFYGLEL